MGGLSKGERFAEFVKRLLEAAPAGNFDEAFALLCGTLNAVEDEFSETAFDPEKWETDGRMYPPQLDSERESGFPRVRCFRHLKHRTLLGDNGSIRIETTHGQVQLDKPGKDGLKLGDLMM